jgi:hypothetical protein
MRSIKKMKLSKLLIMMSASLFLAASSAFAQCANIAPQVRVTLDEGGGKFEDLGPICSEDEKTDNDYDTYDGKQVTFHFAGKSSLTVQFDDRITDLIHFRNFVTTAHSSQYQVIVHAAKPGMIIIPDDLVKVKDYARNGNTLRIKEFLDQNPAFTQDGGRTDSRVFDTSGTTKPSTGGSSASQQSGSVTNTGSGALYHPTSGE